MGSQVAAQSQGVPGVFVRFGSLAPGQFGGGGVGCVRLYMLAGRGGGSKVLGLIWNSAVLCVSDFRLAKILL